MNDKKVLVYLARHGTTVLNKDECFRGPADPPLDGQGFSDAHNLAKYFHGIPFQHVFSSDKKRALSTAQIICEHQNVKPEATPVLHAWNLGFLAGQKKDEHDDDIAFFQKNPEVQVPEGESLRAFQNRVRPALKEAVKLALATDSPVLIVTHSSVIHEAGAAINGDHDSSVVKPGGVAQIFVENGKLGAEPIYRPGSRKAQTVIS